MGGSFVLGLSNVIFASRRSYIDAPCNPDQGTKKFRQKHVCTNVAKSIDHAVCQSFLSVSSKEQTKVCSDIARSHTLSAISANPNLHLAGWSLLLSSKSLSSVLLHLLVRNIANTNLI